ncbi:VanZ family protein [Parasphingorhabdus pacifica]
MAVVAAVVSVLLRRILFTASSLRDALIDASLVFLGLSVAYLVLMPQPSIPERAQLPPGMDFSMAMRAGPGDTTPWVQLAGNLVLLLPLGAMLPLRLRWFDNVGRIATGGLLLSCAIELTQFFVVVGRVASTDDIVLNTFGATLGGLLVRPPWRHYRGRERPAPVAAGPQHSGSARHGRSVWRLIDEIEEERRWDQRRAGHRGPAGTRTSRASRGARDERRPGAGSAGSGSEEWRRGQRGAVSPASRSTAGCVR